MNIATHRFIPALNSSSVVKPPIIRNSPCAKLMTRIIPKMIARPRLISARLAIANSTWVTMMAAKSIFTAPQRMRIERLLGRLSQTLSDVMKRKHPLPI